MIEVVINYNISEEMFKVYESSTDTLIVAKNLTEALVNLSEFLHTSGIIEGDILSCTEIMYHIDSQSMKTIVESNVNLLKRLNTAPSAFLISSQRFGGSTNNINLNNKSKYTNKDFNKGKFGKKSLGFGKSSFKSSDKKFGNKN